MAKAMKMEMDDKWQAECDLRTLMEAEKVKKDAKRMAAVRKMAREQIAMTAQYAGDEGEKA